MKNEMNNQPQVYSVIGGYNYEGESFDSLQLFDCKSAAEQYKKDLQDNWNYDYVLMEIKTINMYSAIAA